MVKSKDIQNPWITAGIKKSSKRSQRLYDSTILKTRNKKSEDEHKSYKLNKSTGYNEINFNVIKKCFGSFHKLLLHIFNQSLQNGIFPDEMKIGRVAP